MKVTTKVQAGGYHTQHNQTLVRAVRVKTSIKAGMKGLIDSMGR